MSYQHLTLIYVSILVTMFTHSMMPEKIDVQKLRNVLIVNNIKQNFFSSAISARITFPVDT